MNTCHANRRTPAPQGGTRRLQDAAAHIKSFTFSLLLMGWAACGVGYAQTTELAFDDIQMNGSGGMVLTADNGYQIVVTGGSSLNASTGQVKLTAPANFTLQAQGFKIKRIEFNNIDDMDDAGPRDSFIATVPGKWSDETNLQVATNSDGLEIFTLDPGVPVSWSADRRDRLRDGVPGVGDILINTSGGENPRKEAASFQPVPTVDRFSIYMDDIDGSRGATMSFFLKPIPEEGVNPLTVTVVDDMPPSLSGPDGFGGTVVNTAMFNTVEDGHDPSVAAMTIESNEPLSSFTLSGPDADRFTLDADGNLHFKDSPSQATPTDTDGDNRYQVQIDAVDQAGNATQINATVAVDPPGGATATDTVAPTVTSEGTGANGATGTYTHTEYSLAPIDRFQADEPVQWTLTGPDAASFEIDPSGVLRFGSEPRHANPSDDDSDNTYELTVTGTDASGNATSKTIEVAVQPKTPTLTGPNGPNQLTVGTAFKQTLVEENYVVVAGSREDGNSSTFNPDTQFDPTAGRNYAGQITSDKPIDGWVSVQDPATSPDGHLFEVTSSGLVFFDHDGAASNDPPDYESPQDANGDNIYEALFEATDANGDPLLDPDGQPITARFTLTVQDLVEGVLPGSEAAQAGYSDRDQDGIPDAFDPSPDEYDPQGFFYCEDDGRIVPGGGIVVTNSSGGSNSEVGTANGIRIVKDGSDGEYQWFAQQEDTFTVQYTPPPGTTLNTAENEGLLDVTNLLPDNPAFVGSQEDGTSGQLIDFSLAANAYYDTFIIEAGDPHVLGNNLALTDCEITHSVAVVQHGQEGLSEQDGQVVFEIAVEDPPAADQRIQYALGGTAEPGVDITADATGTAILPAGETVVRIHIPVVDDGLIEGDETVTLSLQSYTEGGIDTPLTPPISVTATLQDNNSNEIRVNPHDLQAMEGQDDHGLLGLWLDGAPTHEVVVTLAGDDQCDVQPTTLVFTPETFAAEQLATVVAISDGIPEGPHSCQPTATVASEDPRFDGLTVNLPAVEVSDGLVDQIRDPLGDLLHARLRAATEHQNTRFSSLARDARQAVTAAADDPSRVCPSVLARQATVQPVVFQPNSDALAERSKATVDRWAETLLRCASVHAEVAGVTGHTNASQAEKELAARRSHAVRRMLIARGVAPERLQTGVHAGTSAVDRDGAPHVTLLEVTGMEDPPAEGAHGSCLGAPEFQWSGYLEGGSEPVTAEADVSDVRYDCRTGVERFTTGRFSASHVHEVGLQSTLDVVARREVWRSVNELHGVAADVEVSQSRVEPQAKGAMDSAALHAGVYGVQRFEHGLFVDYFAFAGLGRTTFDVQFLPSGGAIAASGGHGSASLHGGVAVSGMNRAGAWTVTPRAGLSVSRAVATDAQVVATHEHLSETGSVAVANVTLIRGFAEPILVYAPSPRTTVADEEGSRLRLELAPHFLCDGDGRGDGIDCGYGAEVTYERRSVENGDRMGVAVSHERHDTYVRTSFELQHRVSVHGEQGTLETRLGASAKGALRLLTTFGWAY